MTTLWLNRTKGSTSINFLTITGFLQKELLPYDLSAMNLIKAREPHDVMSETNTSPLTHEHCFWSKKTWHRPGCSNPMFCNTLNLSIMNTVFSLDSFQVTEPHFIKELCQCRVLQEPNITLSFKKEVDSKCSYIFQNVLN